MSEFTVHTTDSAPEAARETLAVIQRRFGFLPNLIGELAAAPPALKAYATLSELLTQTSLGPVAQQVVLIATSIANRCEYCVAAHSAGLKAAGLADDQIDALRNGRPLADAKLEALRAFTTAVVERRGWVKQTDVEQFLKAGHRREQVFEVLLGVSMKTLSNYANHIARTSLDRQFQPFAWELQTT